MNFAAQIYDSRGFVVGGGGFGELGGRRRREREDVE